FRIAVRVGRVRCGATHIPEEWSSLRKKDRTRLTGRLTFSFLPPLPSLARGPSVRCRYGPASPPLCALCRRGAGPEALQESLLRVCVSISPAKYFSRAARKSVSSGAACANRVIEE